MKRIALAAAALTLLAGRPALAQSAAIQATASVVTPLTVTPVSDLQFGTVYPGVNKSIAYSDANAGKLSVAGYTSAEVTLSFTLPATLTGPSGNTMPIGTWAGYHNTTNSAASGGTSFVPAPAVTTTTLSGTGALYVFIGARVTPSSTQAAGSYSNTLTMTVAYTGN